MSDPVNESAAAGEPMPAGPTEAAPRRPGAITMLLPLAVMLFTFAALRGLRGASPGERAEPPTAESLADVQGWAGELGDPVAPEVVETGGPRLVASLRPLHADPAQQAFDRDALRRGLALPEGEPWRLELRYRPGRKGDAPEPLAIRDFDALRVRGAGPAVLRPFPRVAPAGTTSSGGALVEPLRTLCAPPDVPLRAGYEVTVLLWGPRPDGPLRIDGLAGGPFDAGRSLVLVPRSLPRDPRNEALAKLER
mgnify:CR=1 FL=1